MRNCIIGTAGHVDHGKTALIKALTGLDTDKLAEEKKRKITIDLGFAHLDTGVEEERFSIIDVPGHKDYLKNMLTGSYGIGFVLLVVALNEGVMPQTKEHLDILNALNAQDGIIVFTKADLVSDDSIRSKAYDDVDRLVADSFLATAPRIEVSTATGHNIELLREEIISRIRTLPEYEDTGKDNFYLPLDRSFTIDGLGTVVTGSLIKGSCKQGDTLYLNPGSLPVKVRSLQTLNSDVQECKPGQRVAINLTGVQKNTVKRGSVLTGTRVSSSSRILCEISVFNDSRQTLKNGSRVFISVGTSRIEGRITFLNCDTIAGGESGYCVLYLQEKYPFVFEDRFIVQDMTYATPVASGVALDSNPGRIKRFDSTTIEYLDALSSNNPERMVLTAIEHSPNSLYTVLDIAKRFNLTVAIVDEAIDTYRSQGDIELVGKYLISRSLLDEINHNATELVSSVGKDNSCISKATLLKRMQQKHYLPDGQYTSWFDSAVDSGVIVDDGRSVRLSGTKQNQPERQNDVKVQIMSTLKHAGFRGMSICEIESQFGNTAKSEIKGLLFEGDIVQLTSNIVISKECFTEALSTVEQLYSETNTISLPEFRDALGISRKPAQVLLEAFDARGITCRMGDKRCLKQNKN